MEPACVNADNFIDQAKAHILATGRVVDSWIKCGIRNWVSLHTEPDDRGGVSIAEELGMMVTSSTLISV